MTFIRRRKSLKESMKAECCDVKSESTVRNSLLPATVEMLWFSEVENLPLHPVSAAPLMCANLVENQTRLFLPVHVIPFWYSENLLSIF